MSLQAEHSSGNETYKNYPLDKPVIAYFEERVRQAPDSLAVQFEGQSLTYAELNRRANRLARTLSEHGVHADEFVGVCMARSLEMVIALVGIVKAGAAYVPFDPDYPAERLAHMFTDSGAKLVLTHAAVTGITFPPGMTPLRTDEADFSATTAADDASPVFRGGPDTAVYMIYTSGSTGKPKGVPNIHRGLTNRLLWMQETFQLGPDDRVLQKTPFSFDVSVWEFFWPLMVGACICVARPGGHRDNTYLIDTVVANGITTLHFVPSMLGLFLAAEGLDRLTGLKRVMCSGEALPHELTRRFFEKLPGTELHNLYGPTEASIDVTWWHCTPNSALNVVPIGFPIANTQTWILDEALQPVPKGDIGELHLGGVQIARGYWNRPELTQEKFIPDPFSAQPGARLYKTGDLARQLPSGAIEYLGRIDFQVKLRGFRIELGEIEAVLVQQPGIQEAVVTASSGELEEKQLVAYVVAHGDRPSASQLKLALLRVLPDYMVPTRFMFLDTMPLSPNGKVDRNALPTVVNQRPELAEMFVAPQTPLQRELCETWQQVLDIDRVGIRDNFFDLGGNSLQLLKVVAAMSAKLGREVAAVKVFQFPSVDKLAAFLSGASTDPLMDDAFHRMTRARGELGDKRLSGAVAVIGMVGRFPGASNLQQLWRNLLNDVESISRFTPEELAEGVDEETRNDPHYIPCRGIIDDADKFDNTFFGIGPQEAKVMDPQQRVFLEMAWHALEDAGHDPTRFPGMIGVYAGVGDNHYYYNNVLCHPDLVKTVGKLIVGYGNEKDYIATRVSYQLDLTGPSVSATTGCSTSLLSIDSACKALNAFECDMALAGGVDIMVPQKSGQIHQAGGPFTSDGHCRPFDADASGTMFCDGAAIVVLRRLEDAIAAGDHIYAVVLGSAKNNDGAQKVSFLAPSVDGQARVIALAQAQANVQADSIGYVEAHGTGTPLGDPIELEALTKAFRATTDKDHFCKIGSIKGHIGHPTIASGIAGFIKVAMSLHTQEIPGTLHFKQPNPRFDLNHSPFEIVAQRTPWPRAAQPRRGAVSSFGFGGTNVHAILEEAPTPPPPEPGAHQQLLLLSAKTPAALDRMRRQFAIWLGEHPNANLADVGYTLQVGRKALACRDFVVAPSTTEAIALWVSNRPKPTELNTIDPPVVFLFPGQGAQYVNMGRDLYDCAPAFRSAIDRCCELFRPHLDRDLKDLLFPPAGQEAAADKLLKDTGYTQPAMFAIELALARWWMGLGVKPAAVVGHSVGEFVGACLGGVFTLEEVIPLVALRAKLIRELPRGAMLSVRGAAKDIEAKLPADVQLAAANGPQLCVVAGPHASIAEFEKRLEAQGIGARLLHTSHAFHSAMMDPAVGAFREAVARVQIGTPTIPFMSTSLGDWVDSAHALGPDYWSQHIRRPVLFADAMGKVLSDMPPATVFLEVGPRDVLATLSRMQAQGGAKSRVLASMGDAAGDPSKDLSAVTSTLGRLWTLGVGIAWEAYRGTQRRLRVPLPTYPFERRSHWLEPLRLQVVPASQVKTESVPQPVASAAPAHRVLADGAETGQPVRGLRLGRDASGLPAWYAPGANGHTPLHNRMAPADPFAPPARQVITPTPEMQSIYRAAMNGGETALAFNEAFAIRLSGQVDDTALEAALQGLAVLHDAVRGHFASGGTEFVIEPTLQVPVTVHNLGALAEADMLAAMERAEHLEASCPYDLEAGPLIRASVLRAGDTERMVVLSAHATVADGWSLDVLLEDLGRLYASLAASAPPSQLPTHGLRDYVAWRSDPAAVQKAHEARTWWHKQLSPPAPPLALPWDQARPSMRTWRARAASRTVPGDAMAALKAFGRNQGVSFFSVLFAGFVRQLANRSGAPDVVVGVSFADHPTAGMEGAVGRLVKVVPIRLRTEADEPFSTWCRRCHAAILDASGHTAVGIAELAGELGLARDGTRPALAALFTYVHEYQPGQLKFSPASVSYHAVQRHAIATELELTVTEAHDRLVLEALALADLASASWLAEFVQTLETLYAKGSTTDGTATPGATLAAPKDALERYLVGVWAQTLGVAEVGVETGFYELGGHSLLALQVFNELHQKYKVRLPLSALVEHSTVRALATHLRAVADIPHEGPDGVATYLDPSAAQPTDGEPATAAASTPPSPKAATWSTIVPLQPKGDLPPLFCVAGLGGNPMNLRFVAQALGANQPFFALQHRGVDGVLRPHETIEAMAAEFIADLRAVQPTGPYYIGGYSFGGLAAYEMAQQLLRAGERVGGLVLLDTGSPQSLKWTTKGRIQEHGKRLLSQGPRYLALLLGGMVRHRKDTRDQANIAAAALATPEDAFAYRIELVTALSNAAEQRYEPLPLNADVLLVKCDLRVPPVDGIGFAPHESNGWRGLVKPEQLAIRHVHCSHLDMVNEPHATQTARQTAAGLAAMRNTAA